MARTATRRAGLLLGGLLVSLALAGVGFALLTAGPGGPTAGDRDPSPEERDPPVPSGSGATTASTPPTPDGVWAPAIGASWQWQLSGAVDTTVVADVFDIDGELSTAETVAALHAKGARVICYVDAGGWESYRSDADSFPESVKGNVIEGWPDERWLDIRALDILLPIMDRRIQECAAKGFDALEPDLLDAFTNDSGFPLTYADQLAYNRAIADLAHKHGLGVALKNDPEQVKDLVDDFDFAIVEECVAFGECEAYLPFIRAGKAVLHAEYEGSMDVVCTAHEQFGFSTIKKRWELDAYRRQC